MLKNHECEPYSSSFILIGNQLVWYEIREKFLAYLGTSCYLFILLFILFFICHTITLLKDAKRKKEKNVGRDGEEA